MEFDEQEEQEEEMEIPETQTPVQPSYDSLGNSGSRSKLTVGVDGRKGNGNDSFVSTVRYRECQNSGIRILIPPSCFCVARTRFAYVGDGTQIQILLGYDEIMYCCVD